MSNTLRFPFSYQPGFTPIIGRPSESNQVIDLAPSITGVGALPLGGSLGPSIAPWKLDAAQTEAPYCDVVIEWTADANVVIGDGTANQMIGLYGTIEPGFGAIGGGRYLLGILGIQLAGTKPQIPILTTAGFAQVVSKVAVYDYLSVGGVTSAINIAGANVTVRARPIRIRSYGG